MRLMRRFLWRRCNLSQKRKLQLITAGAYFLVDFDEGDFPVLTRDNFVQGSFCVHSIHWVLLLLVLFLFVLSRQQSQRESGVARSDDEGYHLFMPIIFPNITHPKLHSAPAIIASVGGSVAILTIIITTQRQKNTVSTLHAISTMIISFT